jgi:hypothetical protein
VLLEPVLKAPLRREWAEVKERCDNQQRQPAG